MSSLRTIVPIKHRKLLRSTLVFALASTSVVCPDLSFGETSSRRTTPTQTKATRSEVALASYAEDDSSNDREAEVIVQASCPNCQANSHSVRSAAPTIRQSQPLETRADYDDATFEDAMPVVSGGCDLGCSSSCDDNMHLLGVGGCGIGIDLDPCSPLGQLSRRLYFRAQTASFWGTGQFLPTLVSTSSSTTLPLQTIGQSTDPDRQILFGGSQVGSDSSNGVRGEIGLWFDDCQSRGVLVRMFDSGDNDVGLSTDQNRNSVIVLNFLRTDPARQESTVAVAFPTRAEGFVNANLSSSTYGGDLLARNNICRDNLGSWDWVGGYQMARLDESLSIVSLSRNLTTNPVQTIDQTDRFRTRSQFHGGALGLNGQVRDGCWYFDGLFKVGVGMMERNVDIVGSSAVSIGTDVTRREQGLHARSTNIGSYQDDTFVMVPEVGLTIGYRLTKQLDFTVGYNLLRLPKVTRVVDALDRELASNLSDPLSGEIRPSFALRESNFSLHSLNLGLQWNY